MVTKVRKLIAMLLENGFVLLKGKGKGSHRRYYHPSGVSATIPGDDGDDANHYLVKQVKEKIQEAQREGK